MKDWIKHAGVQARDIRVRGHPGRLALDGHPQKADERRWMRAGKIASHRPQDMAIGRGRGRPRPDKRRVRFDQWLLCVARLLEHAGLRGRAEVLAGKLCDR